TDGRIEVRAKLPTGRGASPAISMLGTNITEVDWPACGEIDIMENVGFDPDRVHSYVHTAAFNHVIGTQKGSSLIIERPYDDFHIYAAEWYQNRIDFFVDGLKHFTFENTRSGPDEWPVDKPHYHMHHLSTGG